MKAQTFTLEEKILVSYPSSGMFQERAIYH